MIRHRYNKAEGTDNTCQCGAGRAQDVHNLMLWRKCGGLGHWHAGPVNEVSYRVRTRVGKVIWWPEFAELEGELKWTRIGDEHGKSLARARVMCEEHRESRESTHA